MTPVSLLTTPKQDRDEIADSDDGPGEPPGQCHIELNLLAQDCDPPLTDWVVTQLLDISRLAGVVGGNLCLAVVDDQEMSRLHEQYKGVAGTTDVLTFDLRDDHESQLEADVVVCLDEAARQASQRNRDTRLEVLLYAVHGLLHLIGFDDVTPQQADVMHQKENELLAAAGFEPLYG
jgi:probable rRNA maturation factor